MVHFRDAFTMSVKALIPPGPLHHVTINKLKATAYAASYAQRNGLSARKPSLHALQHNVADYNTVDIQEPQYVAKYIEVDKIGGEKRGTDYG